MVYSSQKQAAPRRRFTAKGLAQQKCWDTIHRGRRSWRLDGRPDAVSATGSAFRMWTLAQTWWAGPRRRAALPGLRTARAFPPTSSLARAC